MMQLTTTPWNYIIDYIVLLLFLHIRTNFTCKVNNVSLLAIECILMSFKNNQSSARNFSARERPVSPYCVSALKGLETGLISWPVTLQRWHCHCWEITHGTYWPRSKTQLALISMATGSFAQNLSTDRRFFFSAVRALFAFHLFIDSSHFLHYAARRPWKCCAKPFFVALSNAN